MAVISDCIGKNIKISKSSITIKGDNGKTCGVIRSITKFRDLQPNKSIDYFHTLKKVGAWGKLNVGDFIIKDGTLYIFRDINDKLFHAKYGYFSEEEKIKMEEKDKLYNSIKENGINVIECIYV